MMMPSRESYKLFGTSGEKLDSAKKIIATQKIVKAERMIKLIADFFMMVSSGRAERGGEKKEEKKN